MREVLMNQWFRSVLFGVWLAAGGSAAVCANPTLVIDADSGQVLQQEEATTRWFPASLTKLMTVYVALHAVQANGVSLDTPFTVSARAYRMAPSKMGFRPGTEVTLDNALKMLMVKSANDLAVTVAEGISGSVEAFAQEMNTQAQRLGMRESYFVNPNGLPDDQQVTSARDMAIVARALYREFPEHRGLYGIGALRLGDMIIRTHNGLMGRYPGADGMKTGFTCAAGFNVVASATRGGRHIIAVVLGSPSARERTAKAVELLERGFSGGSSFGGLDALPSRALTSAPNLRWDVCVRHGKSHIAEETEEAAPPPLAYQSNPERPERDIFLNQAVPVHVDGHAIAALPRPYFEPISVYIGRAPGWNGPPAAVASDNNVAPVAKPVTGASSRSARLQAAKMRKAAKTAVRQAKRDHAKHDQAQRDQAQPRKAKAAGSAGQVTAAAIKTGDAKAAGKTVAVKTETAKKVGTHQSGTKIKRATSAPANNNAGKKTSLKNQGSAAASQ
jgi:D-alanyl-D-alanine carboxypeptidase